ncbi:hypothetical protein KUTeg_024820 [Tegillarca granosa]|uniref:PiggyBac transposable element-derived protein domain-containing protein n=1 Tax=Tegillarca granosa TaxID=220873 RepID=A0ABQ9E2D4_TEGGR|nr:hypothetical protein KUTeg_024820 [Tegillarca granosa]
MKHVKLNCFDIYIYCHIYRQVYKKYLPVALEHIHGIKVDGTPNMTDICNKNQSYDQVPPHKLRRNGQGLVSCIRHNTVSNVIHVTAWTNDTQLKQFSTDFGFVCFTKYLQKLKFPSDICWTCANW